VAALMAAEVPFVAVKQLGKPAATEAALALHTWKPISVGS
jgi:hypothetical protein